MMPLEFNDIIDNIQIKLIEKELSNKQIKKKELVRNRELS